MDAVVLYSMLMDGNSHSERTHQVDEMLESQMFPLDGLINQKARPKSYRRRLVNSGQVNWNSLSISQNYPGQGIVAHLCHFMATHCYLAYLWLSMVFLYDA